MDDFLMGDAAPRRPPASMVSLVVKRAPLIVAVSLVVAGLAYVALLPNRYVATARIELPQGAENAGEVSRMLSQSVLAQAVTRLPPAMVAELRQTASDTVDITTLLARTVQIQETPDAGIVRLVSVAQNPTSALGFVNGLADAYLSVANGTETPVTEAGQERLLSSAQPLPAPADGKRQALGDRIAAAQQGRVALEAQADLAETLLERENFYALAREFDSFGTMVNRVQQLADLQGQRDMLSATLLSSHPKMRVLDERIATLTGQLKGDGQQLVDAARGEIAAARQTEAALKSELQSLSAASGAATAGGPVDAMTTGAINPAAGKLISVSVQPQQKLVPPVLGAGVSGVLALLAQVALLLRRPRTINDDVSALRTPAETSEQDEADLLEPTMTDPVPATEDAATPVSIEEAVPAAGSQPAEPSWVPHESVSERRDLGSEGLVPAIKGPEKSKTAARIVVVSSTIGAHQAQAFASALLDALTRQGQRVAVVDAASRLRTAAAGISDLGAGRAGYADVVHFDEEKSLTTVSWGRRASLRLDAEPIRILIEALGALSDVVIVVIGNASAHERRSLLAIPGALDTVADPVWDQDLSVAAA